MNLADILKLKFSAIDLVNQVRVADKGDGPYIEQWDSNLGPLPDSETLLKWELEVTPVHQAQEINNSIFQQLNEIDLKSIRSLRDGSVDRLKILEEEAVQLRTQLIK